MTTPSTIDKLLFELEENIDLWTYIATNQYEYSLTRGNIHIRCVVNNDARVSIGYKSVYIPKEKLSEITAICNRLRRSKLLDEQGSVMKQLSDELDSFTDTRENKDG